MEGVDACDLREGIHDSQRKRWFWEGGPTGVFQRTAFGLCAAPVLRISRCRGLPACGVVTASERDIMGHRGRGGTYSTDMQGDLI